MNADTFKNLCFEQQWSLIVAIAVRDALEPFHLTDRLPQEEMPEFNRRVRRAVLTATYAMMHLEKPGCRENVSRAIAEIPDYWEIPALLPDDHEYFNDGPTLAWSEKYPNQKYKIETWCKTGQFPEDSG